MPKNKNWFDRLKDRLFPATYTEEGKAKGRKKWVFKRPHSLVASASSKEESQQTDLTKRQSNDDSDTEKNNGSSSDALHLATTASAGVSDAKDVSEALLWSAISLKFPNPCEGKSNCGGEVGSYAKIKVDQSALTHNWSHIAAIKIQRVFRGYLARKALRALKGLVKLQAIIRGRAVRRRTVATLKCLQSIVHIQSQVCATRYHLSQEKVHRKEKDNSGLPRSHEKTALNNRRRWDDNLLTEEEEESSMLLRNMSTRREKMKADSPDRRHSGELEERRLMSGKLRTQVEQYKSGTVPHSEEIKRVDTVGGKQFRRLNYINTTSQQPCIHGLDSPTLTLPRRSLYHNKRRSMIKAEDDELESWSKSPVVPTYMASTESAKAKARSSASLISSPRRGRTTMGHQLSALSDGDSPYKCKIISPMSSINSERTWTGTNLSVKNMDQATQYSHHRPRCLQGTMDAAAARPS